MTTPLPTVRLRYLLSPREETGRPDLEVLSVYRDHGVVPKASRDDNFNKTPVDLSRYQVVRKGDLVVNKMKAWQGSVAVSQHYGIVSPDYLVCSVDADLQPRYLHFLLRSLLLINEFRMRSKGIRPAQWRLYWEDLADISIQPPAPDEQRRIADFLDAETSRIDRMIELRQKQSDLLDVRLAHLIDGVIAGDASVLKEIGCSANPDVWKKGRVARLCDIIPGYAFPSDKFLPPGQGVNLLRGANVAVDRITWSDCVAWNVNQDPIAEQFHLRVGDLVMGMDRPWISTGMRLAWISQADLPALLLQRVACLRPRQGVSIRYIKWALSSRHFRQAVELELTGVSVPHISGDQIGRFTFSLPTIDDQESLARALDAQASKTADLKSCIQRQLAALAERRQALITAAVTGQIDVTTARGVEVR